MIEWLDGLQGGWATYATLFFVMYISGAGLPIPEELPLAFGGYLIAGEIIDPIVFAACIFAALVLGDLTAYGLGRIFGLRLRHVWPFSWALTHDRFEIVKNRFRANEGKAIFFGRFVTGVRLVSYIVCGATHVPIVKFVSIDAIAIIVYAPMPVLLGYWLQDVQASVDMARKIEFMIAVGAVIGVAAAFVHWRRHTKRLAAQTANSQAPASEQQPTG